MTCGAEIIISRIIFVLLTITISIALFPNSILPKYALIIYLGYGIYEMLKPIKPFTLVEHAATSPATLIQLATSSPYEVSGWVRPVRQRGMYFGAPSWHR